MSNVALGKRGEATAALLLQKNGYQILKRNVKAKFGEIDIVAKEGKTLCFVEIKARSGLAFGFPEEGVTAEKRWRLARLAQWYLLRYRISQVPVRFDVVSLLFDSAGELARSRLIRNAFDV